MTEGRPARTIGERFSVQVQGTGGSDALVVKMRIVRCEASGIIHEFVKE